MKKIFAILLTIITCLSLTACGGEVKDIEVNGENVQVTAFLIEKLNEYMSSEEYLNRQKIFEDVTFKDAKELTVTKVIEVSADNLGENQISVHFLAVKADCDWAKGENEIFTNILLIVDYETGKVYDEFTIDASWADMNGTKEQEIFYMLNGPLVGDGYNGGTIIVPSEKRTNLSKKDISTINDALGK